jgi:hypothetical protein
MVPVTIDASVADACGGAVRCRVVSVTSNDPIDASDWMITGDLTLRLRAERSSKRNARIYDITVVCTDPSGNQSTKQVTVTVPR